MVERFGAAIMLWTLVEGAPICCLMLKFLGITIDGIGVLETSLFCIHIVVLELQPRKLGFWGNHCCCDLILALLHMSMMLRCLHCGWVHKIMARNFSLFSKRFKGCEYGFQC